MEGDVGGRGGGGEGEARRKRSRQAVKYWIPEEGEMQTVALARGGGISLLLPALFSRTHVQKKDYWMLSRGSGMVR